MTHALKAQVYEHRINDLERVQYKLLKKVDNLEIYLDVLKNLYYLQLENQKDKFDNLSILVFI